MFEKEKELQKKRESNPRNPRRMEKVIKGFFAKGIKT